MSWNSSNFELFLLVSLFSFKQFHPEAIVQVWEPVKQQLFTKGLNADLDS